MAMPQTEAQLQAYLRTYLGEHYGPIRWDRITGKDPLPFKEHDVDPDNPSEGCVVYCVDDNGAGKRELRAKFATGNSVAIATEP